MIKICIVRHDDKRRNLTDRQILEKHADLQKLYLSGKDNKK